jgi:hypothetical protein
MSLVFQAHESQNPNRSKELPPDMVEVFQKLVAMQHPDTGFRRSAETGAREP